MALVDEIREACAWVAARAVHVTIAEDAIAAYAAALPAPSGGGEPDPPLVAGPPEQLAAFHLTLDAVNFGSGWFPTLRKREDARATGPSRSALRDRFAARGAWSASELRALDAARDRGDARPGSRSTS